MSSNNTGANHHHCRMLHGPVCYLTMSLNLPFSAVALSCLMLFGGSVVAFAQSAIEWSAETRTSFAFRVRDEAVQRLLPDGWSAVPSTAAASRGANLTVTIMERLVVLDGQGKPIGNGTSRYVTIGVPARHAQTGETVTMVVSGLSPEGPGAYGVYETANVSRLEHLAEGEGQGHRTSRESWVFTAQSGDRLEGQLVYRRAAVTRARSESKIRSGRRPEFSRTYRIEQAADVVRSVPAGVDRVESLTFTASGPHLSALFDGSESLVSITAVPYYVRDISVP